jgi:hypothetical protein
MSADKKEKEGLSPSLLLFTGVALLKDVRRSAFRRLNRPLLMGLKAGIDFVLKKADDGKKPDAKKRKIEIK